MIFTFTLLLCEISFAADDVISFLTKTLPFKVSVINEVPSISARYFRFDRDERYLYQVIYQEISSSGKYLLLMKTKADSPWEKVFEIYSIVDGEKLEAKFLEENNGSIQSICWDPTDDKYIFACYRVKDGDGYRAVISRQRWNGEDRTYHNNNNESARLVDISSDGKWLLILLCSYINGAESTDIKWVIQSTDNVSKRSDAGWAQYCQTLSPSMKLAVSSLGRDVMMYNIQSKSLVHFFNIDQANFVHKHTPTASEYGLSTGPYWLSDSSGVLFNIPKTKNIGETAYELWYITTAGEVRMIFENIYIITCSGDGNHWLIEYGGKWYGVKEDTNKVQ